MIVRIAAMATSAWLAVVFAGSLTPALAQPLLIKPTANQGDAMSSLTDASQDADLFPKAAEAALEGPGGVIPSVAWVGEASYDAALRVNGFPLDLLGCLQTRRGKPIEADYLRLAPIHPYFLKPGDNVLQCQGASGGAIAIARWDYVHGGAPTELFRGDLPSDEPFVFRWESKTPEWNWSDSAKITADESTKQGLYRECVSLHSRLSYLATAAAANEPTANQVAGMKQDLLQSTREFVTASELRGKPYRLIDQILEASTARALPGNPAGSLVLAELRAATELELEVFADGVLARLKPSGNAPLFAFNSNLEDGPRGLSGTIKLAFDAWYRINERGEWQLDALFPRVSPSVQTQARLGPYDLEALYRLSIF